MHYIQAMVYANVGMDRIIETYTKGKNSFGYTEVSRAEQQGMNDAFNDLFKKG